MQTTPPALRAAVGLVFNAQQQILVSLRKAPQSFAGFWEFPGGKLEPGESSYAALKRELLEEVGLCVEQAELFTTLQHEHVPGGVLLDIWRVYQFSGEPYGLEGQSVRWVDLTAIQSLNFLPANQPLVNQLLAQIMQ